MIARDAVLVLLALVGACGPSARTGDDGADGGSTTGLEATATDFTTATPEEGVDEAAPDTGADDRCSDCCPSLPDAAEQCAAVVDRDSCASVAVGDDFCVWIDWYPVQLDDALACGMVGDARGECRVQTCQSEGCYSGDSCGGGFADIVVVADGGAGREIGIGPWCIPEGEICHFVEGVADVDSPPECACACSPIASCSGPVEPYVDAWAASSAVEPVACGVVGADDTVETWNAARQCAVVNAGRGIPFTVVFGRPVDGASQAAFAAREADGFEIVEYGADERGGAFTLARRTCGALDLVAGCDFGVGEPCLECVDAGGGETICPR